MSLPKRIIPCLDVKEGRVVKGINFVNLRDAGDPAELAARYAEDGADEIVFLDITASLESRSIFLDTVSRTAEQIFIPLTVGGGVRNVADIDRLLRAGADRVSLNTAALEEPEIVNEVADRFGVQCIVVAIDAKREDGKWTVHSHGGRNPTGKEAISWAKEMVERGAGEILLTSIDADGSGGGYDLKLTRAIVDAISTPVIASGGAGDPSHLLAAFVDGGADAALASSIFHYDAYSIGSTKQYLAERNVAVRR